MIKGACYVRVSTENQLENYSIEEQISRLKAYCQAKDITIVKIYTDGGYSGGTIDRPALQQMLKDINYGEIDIVVVYKLDRLSRSQKDTLMLIEDYFLANKVDFLSINENFDTSTPFGRAMIGILSVFAQLEKDQITERFTMGRVGRAKNGYFHGGGYAPTGYDYVDGQLLVNEYEAIQVKDLFERFANGHSLHNCWLYMQNKYTTKYGAWKSETLVRNVLKNELYIGKVKFKGVSYPGNHEPLISQELFQTVQNMFSSSALNTGNCRRSPFKAGTLLSNMIICGKCGARYHGEHGNYSCYSRTKGDKRYIIDPSCKNKKWKISELDHLVLQYITQLNFSDIEESPHNVTAIKDYSRRLKEIEKQISNLIALYQVGNIPIEKITDKIKALIREKDTLMAELRPNETIPPKVEKKSFRDKLLLLLESGDLQKKRACLSNIIEKIVLTNDDVEIYLR